MQISPGCCCRLVLSLFRQHMPPKAGLQSCAGLLISPRSCRPLSLLTCCHANQWREIHGRADDHERSPDTKTSLLLLYISPEMPFSALPCPGPSCPCAHGPWTHLVWLTPSQPCCSKTNGSNTRAGKRHRAESCSNMQICRRFVSNRLPCMRQ